MEYYTKAHLMYPNAKCELNYTTNFSFLIAVILSSQTKDVNVNKITPILFEKYPTINDLAHAKKEEVEAIIKPLGLSKMKSQNLIKISNEILSLGKIPNNIDELQKLSGVGNKTACVYMQEIHKEPHIAVDTHLKRVSNRLGLSCEEDPGKIQKDLEKRYKKELWISVHHTFLFLGRYTCLAKNPKCNECKLSDICLYFNGK